MPYTTAAIGQETWASFILEGLNREAVLLASGARRILITGKSAHVPIAAGATPAWLAELEEMDEDPGAPDEVELVPKKVGVLTVASNESVTDAAADVLDTIGSDAVRAVARAADDALFSADGTGNQPTGLLELGTLPTSTSHDPSTYSGLANGAAIVRAAGGRPNVAYVNPTDHLALQLAVDGLDRPLLQNTEDGPAEVVAGLRIWPTPAVPAGLGIVGQSDQILVGVRSDPSIAISGDAKFGADAVAVRTIARVDVGVGNTDALVVIGTAA